MEKTQIGCRLLWAAAPLAILAAVTGIGLGQIQPVGKKAGLIQFDAVIEMYPEQGMNWAAFARYWVCQDFYAVSQVWNEPRVFSPGNLTMLSDKTGFRIENGNAREFLPVNTTYPKPLGERGPFPIGGAGNNGIALDANMRFADAEAASRRVHTDDLGSPAASRPRLDGVTDVKMIQSPDGVRRKVAQLKVRAAGNCIQSVDLLDDRQQPLGHMKYEYEQGGAAPQLSRLIADWPERPQKLTTDIHSLFGSTLEPGMRKVDKTIEIDYTSHKGGRTATVIYKDVALGDKVMRLPVQVEVRRTSDKRLLRTAKLMNFKRVEMDEAGVWQAAKAFASYTSEDEARGRLGHEYRPLLPAIKHIPLQIDPNDVAFVERMTAKYPVAEQVRPPQSALAGGKEKFQEWQKQTEKNKPPQMKVEPEDANLIRTQIARFHAMTVHPMTPEERATYYAQGWLERGEHTPECEQQIRQMRFKLEEMLRYHHVPPAPEAKPKAVESNDLKLVRQLQGYYERLATQQDRGLGGQLKALTALASLDELADDHSAQERHQACYLQMLRDNGLSLIYMAYAFDQIKGQVAAHHYSQANALMKQWADFSAANCDAEGIFRVANQEGCGVTLLWANIQLLDRLLKEPGLSSLDRYEALALRAIALDGVDRFLASSEARNKESSGDATAEWILSGTTKAAISKLVVPAVRQARSAWESLGPASENEAKPYSTADLTFSPFWDLRDISQATPLQEISAQLNQIAQQRLGQQDASPRSGTTVPRAAPPSRRGTQGTTR
jgi:hypothetical protein